MGDCWQSAFGAPYGHSMACPYRKATDMEDSNANQATSPSPIGHRQSPTARRSGGPQDGATRLRSCRRRACAPAASHPSATGMAQTSSCEVCDVPEGQARTGNSIRPLPDSTRRPARRPAALLIYLVAALAAAFKEIKNRGNELKDLLQRQGITEIAASKRTHFGDCRGTACRPLAGAILHDPG